MSISRNVNSNMRKKCLSCVEKENHVKKTINRCKGCVCNQIKKITSSDISRSFLIGGSNN